MALAESFVARESELRRIIETMNLGLLGGVLLHAPSGAGKSSLANEALRRAAAEGLPTAAVHASLVSRRVPLGALSAARELGIANNAATLTPTELADRCVETLRRDAAGKRLVLLVDDAHLLDDISLLVIERLAHTEHVFLVLTARTGEDEFPTLADLGRQGLLLAIPVPPLDQEEVRSLVEHSLAGEVDAGLTQQLFEHGEGNPLLVLELLMATMEKEQVVLVEGVWTLRGQLSASHRIREVVESRLYGLGSDERALLESLVFVDRLDRQAIETLSTIEALAALEARGLVSTTLEHRRLLASLAHPVYGDVLRSGMSGLRTQEVTRSLSDYLETQPGLDDSQCLQVASLRLICGGGDAGLMARAAQIALGRHDMDLALECADAAVEVDGGFDWRILRARVLTHRGQFHEADLELVGCLDLAKTDEQLIEAAVLRLDFLTFYQGHIDDGLQFAADVEKRVADPSLRRSLAVRRAGALLHTDGPKAVADAVAPLLDDGATEVESWACMLAAWASLRLGRFDEAYATNMRGEAAQGARTQPTDWYPELHSVVRCYIQSAAGDFEAAQTTARLGLTKATEEHSAEAVGGYSLLLATLVRDCGHTEEALGHADAALSTYRALSIDVYVADSLVHRAMALGMAGRGPEAVAVIEEVRRAQLSPYWYFSPELHQALGWGYAASGLRQQAKSAFIESAAIGARSGDLLGALTAWHGCARIGFPGVAVEPMKRIVRQTDSAFLTLRLRHVIGLATHDAPSLQDVSEQFEQLGADLLAAEAAAEAAEVLHRRGPGRAAEKWQRRATSLFRRQNGPVTTVLQPQATGDLTTAESDTVRLAAQGNSNAEIAAAQGLSVRTVENRLQRAYVKLGVSSRQALADLDV